MIIIKLQGGLGNQLFQYAFARSLSLELNEELFIDISYFGHDRPQHVVYGLHPYNIRGVIGNYPLINSTKMCLNNQNEQKLTYYPQAEPFTTWGHMTSDDLLNIDKIELPAYFDGFYQNFMDLKNSKLLMTERFYKKYIDIIHSDLEYMVPLSVPSQSIVNDMKNYDSIALHVRRGDYKSVLDFGLCSKEYFEKSIELMISKLENPKFFIFCEDMEWARNNLKIDAPHRFVDFEEDTHIIGRGYAELLKVMSSCDHFIIANSTFSWWGAFLGENKEKIIITPKPWFQSRRVLDVETIDNKKTLSVVNNNSEIFNNSNNLLYSLTNNDFKYENLDVNYVGNSIKITNIFDDSKIILKSNNYFSNSQFIIKISLESNYFDNLKVYFKTTTENKYSDKNSLTTYYYENDSFNQYLLLPENSILNELMIKPGGRNNNPNDYLIIHSIDIKEIK